MPAINTSSTESSDRLAMLRALELAQLGAGHVEPNPMVGCVIVRAGRTVGEGWHRQFGREHAEVEALRAAGEAAYGATLYVTLEPCCHTGKTPPCTQAVISSGIRRIFIATRDPNPDVAGGGMATLQAAGLQVEMGLLQQEAEKLIAPFSKLSRQGRPWILAKWAMTLDGKLATRSGSSQWISGAASRKVVHQLRGRVDGIVVGRGTMLADDPQLTARPSGPRTATRIVLDTWAQMPIDSQLALTSREIPVLLAVSEQAKQNRCKKLERMGVEVIRLPGVDRATRLTNLLDLMGKRRMTNLLVEGGGEVLGAFFDSHEVNEIHTFIAPKLVGGSEAIAPLAGHGRATMADAHSLEQVHIKQLEGDVYIQGRMDKK